MQEGSGEGRPGQQLTIQKPTRPDGQGGANRELTANRSLAEREGFYPAFWEDFIARSSLSPSGEDPAFLPVKMLFELEDLAINREFIKDPKRAALAEMLAPIKDSVRKMRMAYAIAAYPYIRNEDHREEVGRQLTSDRKSYARDQIVLNDTEFEIVRGLCETPRYALYGGKETIQPRIPIDPQKRVFKYAKVHNPSVESLKPLNDADFIAHQAGEAGASEVVGEK